MARSSSPANLSVSLLAVLIGAGCGGASTELPTSAIRFDACRPLTLVVDEGASARQMLGIHAAIDLWNGPALTRLQATSPLPAGEDPGTPTLPLHFRTAAEPSHGFFDPLSGEILINKDLSDHALAVTVAHEVGHAFGLVHVTDRPSVMAPGNLNVEPSADDVRALAELWGPCPPIEPRATQ